MKVLEVVERYRQTIGDNLTGVLLQFFGSYLNAVDDRLKAEKTLAIYLELIVEQIANPFAFELYHQAIFSPFDYYQFGLDFIRPLVVLEHSTLRGGQRLAAICHQLELKENVILFGNHQIEPDPQVISLLLAREGYGEFAKGMIFVAGHKVTTDPIAVPLSKGRNLLCIHSKRHIDTPPDLKQAKMAHNQMTMRKMGQLLSAGGYCIYVAPSGGRDRRSDSGKVEVAPFDPQSIEMFWLIAQQAKRPTNFYPLAISSYNLLPPPAGIVSKLGEERLVCATAVHLAFGQQVEMESFPGAESSDRKERRAKRAEHIWQQVVSDYAAFIHPV